MSIRSMLLASAGATAVLGSVLDLPIKVQNGYRLVTVDIGTPPTPFEVLFDTGSATLWVLDGNCTTCINSSGYQRQTYNVTSSSTGKLYPQITDTIGYSSGTVTGTGATDMMSIPGTNVSVSQSFADISSSSWSSLGADGFLGLASSSIAFTGTQSVFQNLMQSNVLDKPRFGIYQGTGLNTIAEPNPTNNGVLTFGDSHETTYSDEEVKFVNIELPFGVYKSGIQSFSGNRTLADGKFFANSLNWAGDFVFDTGAGNMVVPNSQVEAIYAMTPFNYTALLHGFLPKCSDFNDSWSIDLSFGNQTFSVTGDMLAQPGYQADDNCFPPFDGWDSDNVIIGARWMSNFYSVWDFGNTVEGLYDIRLGFAPLKKEYLPVAV